MQYKFTNRAEKALKIANDTAVAFGHSYIGTEHLLYGLSDEGNGVASKVLELQNVTPENIIDEIEDLIGVINYEEASEKNSRIYTTYKKSN